MLALSARAVLESEADLKLAVPAPFASESESSGVELANWSFGMQLAEPRRELGRGGAAGAEGEVRDAAPQGAVAAGVGDARRDVPAAAIRDSGRVDFVRVEADRAVVGAGVPSASATNAAAAGTPATAAAPAPSCSS